MHSFRIFECFICKASLFCSALYAKWCGGGSTHPPAHRRPAHHMPACVSRLSAGLAHPMCIKAAAASDHTQSYHYARRAAARAQAHTQHSAASAAARQPHTHCAHRCLKRGAAAQVAHMAARAGRWWHGHGQGLRVCALEEHVGLQHGRV